MPRNFTVSAAPAGAFVVPADGVAVIDTAAETATTGVGATVAASAAMDSPLVLPGGEEVEEMGGPNNLNSLRYGYEDSAFLVSAPTHVSISGGPIDSTVRHFPPTTPLVLARSGGRDVSVRLTNASTSATARYLVGSFADTPKIGTTGFMGATLAAGASVDVVVPHGQRIAFVRSAGTTSGNMNFLCLNAADKVYGCPHPVPPPRARLFQPAGRHAGLGTLGYAHVPFKVRRSGAPSDETLTAVVRRAIPATQPAVSAVALDTDGDPVSFRFDRLHRVGRALDGRPFVIAPNGVRLMRNTGGVTTVQPNRVARWLNADLLVVKAAGQVPSIVQALGHSDEYATISGAAAPDFTSWPTAVTEATGLTLAPQFESIHVYLQSADTAATRVRFRRLPSGTWYEAQPLVYDARDPAAVAYTFKRADGSTVATTMAEVTPGNHRNVISHLRSKSQYEVEVLQGAKLWRAATTTLNWKRTKVSAVLGTVDGNVAITRSGDVVTVTRAGLPDLVINAPVATTFAEIHSGLVRGGTVTVDANRIIIRDVDVIAPPGDCYRFTPKAEDVRIVRGRVDGWGPPDNLPGYDGTKVGWADRYYSAFSWPDPGGESAASRGVALIGAMAGAPRYPANHWEQYNPSTAFNSVVDVGKHPWGSTFVFHRVGSFYGSNALYDCSFAGNSLRPCEDAVMCNNRTDGTVAGLGPNSVVAHSYFGGWTDDGLEMDGSNQNLLVLGNWFDMERGVDWVSGPVSAISLSACHWGPTIVRRNVFRGLLRKPDLKTFAMGTSGVREQSTALKVKRIYSTQTGVCIFDHNTIVPSAAAAGKEGLREFYVNHGQGVAPNPATNGTANGTAWLGYVRGRANLARILRSSTISAPAAHSSLNGTPGAVVWTENDIARDTASPLAFTPDSAIPEAAVVAATALFNVNDGGPWGMASPSAGAA